MAEGEVLRLHLLAEEEAVWPRLPAALVDVAIAGLSDRRREQLADDLIVRSVVGELLPQPGLKADGHEADLIVVLAFGQPGVAPDVGEMVDVAGAVEELFHDAYALVR